MKTRCLIMLILMGMIVMAGCGTDEDWVIPGQPTPPAPKPEPTMIVNPTLEAVIVVEEQPVVNAEDAFEAQVRYIIADIQLGNVDGYYRGFLDQPAVADAISRWDAGIRVQNITDFERIINGDAGWQVVYIGTTMLINGMDVILTEAETAQAAYYCNNPYWPIAEGATWTYIGTSGPRSGETQTWSVSSVIDYGTSVEFTIDESTNTRTYQTNYVCDDTGIYSVDDGGERSLYLPPQDELMAGNSYAGMYTEMTIVDGFDTLNVPLGGFEVVIISRYQNVGPVITWSYSDGTGPVQFPNFGGEVETPTIFGLTSYILP